MQEQPKENRAYKKHLKKPFLDAFRKTGTIFHAARAVGINRATVDLWRKNDPDFARDFIETDFDVTEILEHSALDRAVKGSETLTIFLLKSRAPKKYLDRMHLVHTIAPELLELLVSHLVDAAKKAAPECCPTCKTRLDIPSSIGKELVAISEGLLKTEVPQ